jgi:hypothetical protein
MPGRFIYLQENQEKTEPTAEAPRAVVQIVYAIAAEDIAVPPQARAMSRGKAP